MFWKTSQSHNLSCHTWYSVHLEPFLSEWRSPYICSKISVEPCKEISLAPKLEARGAWQPSHVGNLSSGEQDNYSQGLRVLDMEVQLSAPWKPHLDSQLRQHWNHGGFPLLNVTSLFWWQIIAFDCQVFNILVIWIQPINLLSWKLGNLLFLSWIIKAVLKRYWRICKLNIIALPWVFTTRGI